MDAHAKNEWVKAACACVFLPLAVNLLVLAVYILR